MTYNVTVLKPAGLCDVSTLGLLVVANDGSADGDEGVAVGLIG